MARPKRKEREIEQRKTEILQAAARVFARSGVQATSMQDIATEAGYAASSLYAYFPKKSLLIAALYNLAMTETEALYDVHLPDGLNFRQKLELLLHHQYTVIERQRETFLALSGAGPMDDEANPRPDLETIHVQRMAEWLSANAGEGELGSFSPVTCAAILAGLSRTFLLLWIREAAARPMRDVQRDVLNVFFFGIAGRPLSDA